MKNVKCIVACVNANGVADFFPVIVRCTESQRLQGDHYSPALGHAAMAGYEAPMLAADEDETLFKAITFTGWDTAKVVDIL